MYRNYDAWEAIPADERERTEKQILRNTFDEVWAQTVSYFNGRDPEQIRRAEENPKRKMALVSRWYLGLSSSWANRGEKGRELDYQIWCGPAMGAFNQWVRGSRLESWEHRRVADVGFQLLRGAAYLSRLQYLGVHGVQVDALLKKVKIGAIG